MCDNVVNYKTDQWKGNYDNMTRNQQTEYMLVLNSIYNNKIKELSNKKLNTIFLLDNCIYLTEYINLDIWWERRRSG